MAENTSSLKIVSMKEFANILFSKYTLPFEVASVLLLAALVGSVVLAMKEKEDSGQNDSLIQDAKAGSENDANTESTGKMKNDLKEGDK